MWTLLCVSLLLSGFSAQQAGQADDDPWRGVRFLVGEWEGESDGQPGKGAVKRSYRFVLGTKFLQEQNVSTYLPQPKNPKGEIHEHWSFISHDRARRTLVFRQFHIEGFVNQYVMLPQTTANRAVFVSEALENVPNGWKARETYEFLPPDEFVETFELAMGDGDYQMYSRARFKRVRQSSARNEDSVQPQRTAKTLTR